MGEAHTSLGKGLSPTSSSNRFFSLGSKPNSKSVQQALSPVPEQICRNPLPCCFRVVHFSQRKEFQTSLGEQRDAPQILAQSAGGFPSRRGSRQSGAHGRLSQSSGDIGDGLSGADGTASVLPC